MSSEALVFDTRVDYTEQIPLLYPDAGITFDPGFSGQWLVAGDLDGDGEAELVTARNTAQSVTAMSAYKLDGTLMWTWGAEGAGDTLRTYDVPVQIYDIDGDGRNEVLYSTDGFLIVAEGVSGRERARFPLSEELEAADCITFARLSGTERASDIIVKTRYTRIWAYTMDWSLLWEWAPPEGWLTCHHPTPVDIDSDGRDEIMAGYTMLDPDGRELWTYTSSQVDLALGHLDCCCVAQQGDSPEEVRLAVTACGANHLALLDGTGRTLWEMSGHHFESVDVGRIREASPTWDLVVDIDHRQHGDSPTWLISAAGEHIGTYTTNYSRFHRLVDIDSDGLQEIILAHARSVCDGQGIQQACFAPDADFQRVAHRREQSGDPGPFALVGDMTGNGTRDIIIHTDQKALLYKNPHPVPGEQPEIGSGINFTLY